MSWLDRLERRVGFLAFPGLIRVVIGFTALVYVLLFLNPHFISIIDMNPAAILRGEVWRLFTYIFIPRAPGPGATVLSPLFLLIALWFLWFIGEGLEREMGPFKLTIYFLLGMFGTTVAAFFFGQNFSNSMLAASLFLAFAWFYPEQIIYLFFILPVKIKWLAWITGAFLVYGFVTRGNAYRAALLCTFINYIVFFGPALWQQTRHRRGVAERRRRFESTSVDQKEPLHRCAVCGATEVTDPNLDFRVASNGEEYCVNHLAQAKEQTTNV